MDEQRFLECLDADFTRLRAVVEGALDAPVPPCPGWTGADLVRHLAEVYLHKTETMRQGVWPAPWPPALPDAALAALDDAYRQLLGELTARDVADRALTWYEPDQTVGFWLRRMAHETVIHRLDAELAAGVAHDPIPADLAEDGIDEVLTCFLAYASAEYPDELGEHLGECDGRTVQIATEGAGWQVQLGPTEVTVVRGESDPEAGVFGEPGAVLRWVWRRAGDGAVQLDGNRWVIGKLRAMLGVTTQ
ncbi:MAG: maleylpyruvate isomerase family mycothiol-dependent enzyme [Actinophytocola sp.]|uniref:maleylpyruvate isomerase family mycothiol-dependent enzyme n=1 Tax=Actinophytocola sp. TaxID=1872138 RepID=UPI003C7367E7